MKKQILTTLIVLSCLMGHAQHIKRDTTSRATIVFGESLLKNYARIDYPDSSIHIYGDTVAIMKSMFLQENLAYEKLRSANDVLSCLIVNHGVDPKKRKRYLIALKKYWLLTDPKRLKQIKLNLNKAIKIKHKISRYEIIKRTDTPMPVVYVC